MQGWQLIKYTVNEDRYTLCITLYADSVFGVDVCIMGRMILFVALGGFANTCVTLST